jgi:hypothetical protein
MSKLESKLLPNYLEFKNRHKRDNQIIFDEEKHKYTILCDKESDYISVTTWLHSHFEIFDSDLIINNMINSRNWNKSKYYGMTKEEIKSSWDANCKEASDAGTKLHYFIECYYNSNQKYNDELNNIINNRDKNEDNGEKNKSDIFERDLCVDGGVRRRKPTPPLETEGVEYEYFMKFANDYQNLIPYRTEWRIWHEDIKLAGSIDMVFKDMNDNCDNSDNDISLLIYDWKRCKNITKSSFNKYSTTECISHIPDSNYWHYCLQLNIYKRILEDKYEKKIADMYLVCLHPDNNNKSYLRIKVVDLEEEVQALFEHRKNEFINKLIYK